MGNSFAEGVNKERGTGVPPVFFHPFQPFEHVAITHRNLPHWQQSGMTYFVTFRLCDSLPASKRDQWTKEKEAWLKVHPQPWTYDQQEEYARLFPRRLNDWLDAGEGSCLLAENKPSQIVEGALRHFDGTRYALDNFVVMPNHVHVLFAPLEGHQLSGILHSWKSFTAHDINSALHRQGPVWFDESHDHIVRSQEQLQFYRAYVQENPVKARLGVGRHRLGIGMGLNMNDDNGISQE